MTTRKTIKDINGVEIKLNDKVRVVGDCKLTIKCFGMGRSMNSMRDNEIATYTVDYIKPEKNLVHLEEGYNWHCHDLVVIKNVEKQKPQLFQFDEKLVSM